MASTEALPWVDHTASASASSSSLPLTVITRTKSVARTVTTSTTAGIGAAERKREECSYPWAMAPAFSPLSAQPGRFFFVFDKSSFLKLGRDSYREKLSVLTSPTLHAVVATPMSVGRSAGGGGGDAKQTILKCIVVENNCSLGVPFSVLDELDGMIKGIPRGGGTARGPSPSAPSNHRTITSEERGRLALGVHRLDLDIARHRTASASSRAARSTTSTTPTPAWPTTEFWASRCIC